MNVSSTPSARVAQTVAHRVRPQAVAPNPATLAPGAARRGSSLGASSSPPVAGVTGRVPAPPPLTGEAFRDGTIYDASAYLSERLGLGAQDTLKLFHHERRWPDAKPGQRVWISTRHSGGVLGKGFYTATRPERFYGPDQLVLELPAGAFAGKKLLEWPYRSFRDAGGMPAGVDVLTVKQRSGVWVIFKPGSDEWLNASANTAAWRETPEVVGWS